MERKKMTFPGQIIGGSLPRANKDSILNKDLVLNKESMNSFNYMLSSRVTSTSSTASPKTRWIPSN